MIDENLEEVILDELSIPHIAFPQDTIQQKKALARHIFFLKEEELLFASSFSFSYTSIIAGITLKHIEYFAKNASMNYKNELYNSFVSQYKVKEVFEIAKAMDEDSGEEITQNQDRIRNVIKYISDNRAVFQF